MRTIWSLLFLILLSSAFNVEGVRADTALSRAWKECQSPDHDIRLKGCTIVIQHGSAAGKSRLVAALDGRCWALHVKGEYIKAVEDCRRAVELNPKYAHAYNNLGSAYLGLSEYSKALQELNIALSLSPNAYWARLNRAAAFKGLGENEKAEADLRFLLRQHPADERAKSALRSITDVFHSEAQSDQQEYRVANVSPQDTLNVREAPSAAAKIVGRLEHDAYGIRVVEKSTDWWLIRSRSTRGWVAARFLEESDSSKPSTFDGYAFQFGNEVSSTVKDLAACDLTCRESPNCRAFTYFKDRALCRLMTRSNAALQPNPVAISRVVDTKAFQNDQIATPTKELNKNPESTPLNSSHRRVALVIGNGAYARMPKLQNPVNDAQDVASSLVEIGFEVTTVVDAGRSEMEEKLSLFARSARGSHTALVFYAGHGLQHHGINYLLPVDAQLEDEADLRRLVRVQSVIEDLSHSSGVRILILDACRDNDAVQALAASLPKTRAATFSRGLAAEKADGLLIAFATQPNRVALDGHGRNSPFTLALLKHIKIQGLEVRTMFTRVRGDVLKMTKGQQRPEVSDSLDGEFAFVK